MFGWCVGLHIHVLMFLWHVMTGVGSHEDCCRADSGMASVRLCADGEELDGHVHGGGWDDHIQLGCGSGEEGSSSGQGIGEDDGAPCVGGGRSFIER